MIKSVNDKITKINKARWTLSSHIRTLLTQSNPHDNIFDQMDEADSQVEAMTNKEVQSVLSDLGLVWSGKHWMNKEFIAT